MSGNIPDELRTVDGFLREHAISTQKHWRITLDGDNPDIRRVSTLFVCSYFSTVWLLRAFAIANPEAAAKAVRELCDILDDGGAVGEWNWHIMLELGIDPDTIDPGPA